MEFGLVIGFTKHLQIAATRNYNVLSNSHILLPTTTHIKSSVSTLAIAWWRLPPIVTPLLLCSNP
jgi:hypothetical protein